jgi:hypothetical protein
MKKLAALLTLANFLSLGQTSSPGKAASVTAPPGGSGRTVVKEISTGIDGFEHTYGSLVPINLRLSDA